MPEADLSAHIASRLEVERILLAATDGAVALRAGVVIGAGSTSFEIIRQIATLFLVQPVPTWMHSSVQPVAASDVLRAITDGLADDGPTGAVDLGGPDVVAYPDLLHVIGGEAGLSRVRVPAPVAPTGLVGLGAALATTAPFHTVTALIESLRHDMVCRPGHTWAPRSGGPPSASRRRCSGRSPRCTPAPRARCPPTRTGPAPLPLLDVVPLPATGRRPPGSPSTASARSSRTPDGRYLRTWRSWTGPGAVHGVLRYRRPVASGAIGPGARRLEPCPSR